MIAAPLWAETVVVTPTLAGQLPGVERKITTSHGDQLDPAISGNIIVYRDERGFDIDVWYYNLSTGQEAPVTTAPGDQQLASVSDGLIVFSDYTTTRCTHLLDSHGTSVNFTASANSESIDPVVDHGLVAWIDDRDGNWEIYAKKLATNEGRRITNSPDEDAEPAVSNGVIVWQRCAGGRCDIFSYDWASATTRQLTATPTGDERHSDISGTNVVYQALRDGEYDICSFDLVTGQEKQLALPGDQRNPSVSGDYVTFDDTATGTYHVGLWHIPSNTVFQVTSGTASQYLNDIDGNRIVYTDDRNGQDDIYMYEFPPLDTPDQFTFGDRTGVALNTPIESNSVAVTGNYVPVPISIAGGSITVNGGAFTSTAGIVNRNDAVTVRLMSSGSYSTTTNVTLTIDGVSDTFSVTTMAQPADYETVSSYLGNDPNQSILNIRYV